MVDKMSMYALVAAIFLAAAAHVMAEATPDAGRTGSPLPAPARARHVGSLCLRGGFEAVMPLKPANLGVPNAWSGQNIGPREKRLRYQHAKARPQQKVQSRWYIDCARPVGDKLLDIMDLERYLRENIKIQGRTGNLAAGKDADQPRVLVYVDNQTRLILQAYIPVAKRYVKYLIKNYLHKRGLRNFVWCVATGKATYKLKYYNMEEIRAAAAAPSLASPTSPPEIDGAPESEGENEAHQDSDPHDVGGEA